MIPIELLKAETVSAKVASVSGEVYLIRNGKILHRLKKGDEILPGQSVVTEKDGYAHLVFPDQRYTRIASDSKFTLTYYVKVAEQGIKAEFFLEKGRITHSVRMHLRHTESFNTRTPVSVTGVRGTEYRLKMVDSKTNLVETLQGNVSVTAGGKTVTLPKNRGVKVAENQSPSEPRILPDSPVSLAFDAPFKILPLSIQTPQVKNAAFCRMRVTTDETAESTILEKTVPVGEDITINNLPDGRYYAVFTSLDRDLFESQPTVAAPFIVRTIPAAPMSSSPMQGRTIFAEDIKIQWLKGEGADHYMVELAQDEQFSEIIDKITTKAENHTFQDLAPGKYYVRVAAVAADGFQSLYSQKDSWTIAASPDIGEVKATPDEGLSIGWAASGENMKYDLQVSRNKIFSDLLVNESDLAQVNYVFEKELEPDTYFIHIRGVLPDGSRGPWSSSQELKIPSGPFSLKHAAVLGALVALIIVL